jgi:hypothetical protein
MIDTKAIADDYYINRLSNAKIIDKHGLDRQKSHISQERVFERLPVYKHKELRCCHCSAAMESKYVSKSADLVTDKLSSRFGNRDLQSRTLVRVEAGQYKGSRWNRRGTAYAVDGGHRVSIPSCILCGHQLGDKCECDSCVELKNNRAPEAAEATLSELESLEPIDIDGLTCNGMLLLFKQLTEFIDDADAVRSGPLSTFGYLTFEQKATLMLLRVAALSADSVLRAIKMVSVSEYYVDWDKIEFTIQSAGSSIQLLARLKLVALNQVRNDLGAIKLLEAWESLAQKEAIGVLEHYCGVHDIYCTPGEHTIAALKRSLNRYGLAQTARYIYYAVRNARNYSSENGFDRHRAFTFIYGNLNFWIEDSRARTYNAPPFSRRENVLAEPEDVSIFSRFFLEQNGISYFTDPISMTSILSENDIS